MFNLLADKYKLLLRKGESNFKKEKLVADELPSNTYQ